MRPQQQNRRIRGRGNNNNNNGNNNRRGPNPLTRTYESNGPDVKIRGTAQQVADKYAVLARDAQSSGDRVMAENYLQHAEHYNRIIAAAQAQLQAQQPVRELRDDEDDADLSDGQVSAPQTQQPQQSPRNTDDGSGPQPVIEGVPAEVALNERQRAEGGRSRGRANGHAHGKVTEEQPATAEQPVAGEASAPSEPVSQAEAPEPAAAPESQVQAQPEAEQKPAKRTRRPRVRKLADAVETSQPEEATS